MLRFSFALVTVALFAGCSGSPDTADAPAVDAPAVEAKVATAVEAAEEAPASADSAAPAEATQPSADGWVSYGAALSDKEAMAASAVISAPDQFVGKNIKVSGEISAVCKSMGCWLTFQHEGQELTVNMADHAFSVDKESAGYLCEAEGEVVRQGELVSLTATAVRMKKGEEKAAPEEEKAAPAEEAASEPTKG